MVAFLCRALSESEPKAKLELSASQSGTLNECKSKTQHEFSERDKEGRIYMEEIKQYRHENKYHITYAQYLSLRQRLRAVMKPDPHTRQDRKMWRTHTFLL